MTNIWSIPKVITRDLYTTKKMVNSIELLNGMKNKMLKWEETNTLNSPLPRPARLGEQIKER